MKENDIVEKRRLIPKGSVLMHGAPSPEVCKQHMEHAWDNKEKPTYEIVVDPDSPSKFAPMSTIEYNEIIEGKVMWVVGKEASISIGNKGYVMVEDIEDGEWIVTVSAPEVSLSAREKAESMTVEELRASIENLRARREKPAKARERTAPPTNDAMAAALSKLSPEQLAKIKEKLGLH